jgi:hypothetical protein
MPARFVSLPGFQPRWAIAPNVQRLGDRLFVVDGNRLIVVDVHGARRLWERSWPQPAPVHYQVPRRPHAHGLRLWTRADVIACLIETEGGVAVVAYDAAAGHERWRTEIATPPPAPWAEAKPAWPGAPTEEMTAMFVATDELAVGLARTSRRSMRWPDIPAPPFRAELDVWAIDAADGRIRARAAIPDVHVPILERDRLGPWLVAGKRLLRLDPVTAQVRPIAELPHEPCWPRARGGQVTVCWRERGALTLALMDGDTGRIGAQHRWTRKGVNAVALHPLAVGAGLQINEQFFVLLGEDLAPRWEARVKPHIYGAAAHAEGAVFVATAGNGGGLFGFLRHSGEPCGEARLPGGVWQPVAVAATERVAAACGPGLVLADARAAAQTPTVIDLPGACALAAAGERRVALLCGEPAPGVHLVGVD